MIIGQYRVIEKIGEGGMGVIYKAEHCTLEQVVAIKSLNVNISGNPELRERFIREARIQAKLSHLNVVNILNFLDIDGNYYIVMEYVEGETLEALIKSRGLIPPDQCIGMFKQVLSGTGYAHSMGIVHRDIKPSNIIIKKDGTVKLTDFGIAKLSGDLQQTKTGVKVGTLWYMSPEQVKGEPASVASDIYSLGATLFEVLTGQVPFSGNSEYSIMKSIVECRPPSPREIYPYVPIHLEQVIMTAMAKEPRDRFRSVDEFAAALENPGKIQPVAPPAVVQPQPVAPAAVVQPQHQPSNCSLTRPRGKKIVAVAAGAVVSCALVALVIGYQSRTGEPAGGERAATPQPADVAAPATPTAGTPIAATQAAPEQEKQVTVQAPAPVEPEGVAAKEEPELEVRHYLRKGQSSHRNGDYGTAISMYQKVLDLVPGNDEAEAGIRDAKKARDAERQLGILR